MHPEFVSFEMTPVLSNVFSKQLAIDKPLTFLQTVFCLRLLCIQLNLRPFILSSRVAPVIHTGSIGDLIHVCCLSISWTHGYPEAK